MLQTYCCLFVLVDFFQSDTMGIPDDKGKSQIKNHYGLEI